MARQSPSLMKRTSSKPGSERRRSTSSGESGLSIVRAISALPPGRFRETAIVAMFTEDGVFEMGPRVVSGRAELEDFYGAVSASPPIPFIQNHVIELAGDGARGTCSVEIRLVQDGEAYTAAGWYEDTYRRVDGSWRFARRDFHVFHWVPLKKGWG